MALPQAGPKLKRCTICRELKPLEGFYKESRSRDGRQSECKECKKARSLRYQKSPRGKEMRAKINHPRKMEGLKKCSKCARLLSVDEFYSEPKSVDGLRSDCKACCLAYQRSPSGHAAITRANHRYRRTQKGRRARIDGTTKHQEKRRCEEWTLTALQWTLTERAFDFRCAYCGCADQQLIMEHIDSDGGTVFGNVVPACLSCNSSKRDKDVKEWMLSRDFDYELFSESLEVLEKGGEKWLCQRQASS